MTTHKVVPVTKEQALKALEDMDDFAGMTVSVNAFGARETLRRFIEQAAPAPSGEAVAQIVVKDGAWWPEFVALEKLSNGTHRLYLHPPAERDAEDAARYRFLRDVAPQMGNRVPHVTQYPPAHFDGDKYLLMQIDKWGMDAAIDAAIAARQGEGNE